MRDATDNLRRAPAFLSRRERERERKQSASPRQQSRLRMTSPGHERFKDIAFNDAHINPDQLAPDTAL